jgi:hypothetical protein
VKFDFPQGVPDVVEAGVETEIPLSIRVFAGAPIDPGSEVLYYRIGDDGPFTADPLEALGGDDYLATLPPLNLGQIIQFYFQVETTDANVYMSPAEGPDMPYEAGVVQVFYSWNMDEDPDWSMDGEWAFGQPTGQGGSAHGNPDPSGGATGDNVCGVNLNGDYSTNQGGPWYLTTTAFDCSDLTGVKLHFQRWLNSDYQPYVTNTVEASTDGVNWTLIWENGDQEITDSAWMEQVFDLSSVADNQPTVYLRWGYEVGGGAWPYSGWNIDDVKIRAIGPSPCYGDINGDNFVNVDDLFELLNGWGGDGPGDLNQDGIVNVDDLFDLLNAWGPCP